MSETLAVGGGRVDELGFLVVALEGDGMGREGRDVSCSTTARRLAKSQMWERSISYDYVTY